MSTPTIHRITPENPPQFPCWVWDGQFKVWERLTSRAFQWTEDTHWCHSDTRPTSPPDSGHEADFVTKTDTPRTDAMWSEWAGTTVCDGKMADLCAQLERELAEAHAQAKQYAAEAGQLAAQLSAIEQDGTKEHNAAVQLRHQVATLREALKKIDQLYFGVRYGDDTRSAAGVFELAAGVASDALATAPEDRT